MQQLPPLSLYVHLPWCERKCPYCDFNSHAVADALPERQYLEALSADLHESARQSNGRLLYSIFIGGGTPSLFSDEAITRLIRAIAETFVMTADCEITLEANPGSAEQKRFRGYRQAGVTRLSIGVQSFNNASLQALGRVHDAAQAKRAITAARSAEFTRVNLDLMHGLPSQTLQMALDDLEQALSYDPGHVSWYQLGIEPNTVFAKRPPELPEDDVIAEIQDRGHAMLKASGYARYEVSAYSRADQFCRHNLNYWRFGDYVGIGAGAHGKITEANGRIRRYWKTRLPLDYMAAETPFTAGERWLSPEELPLEFLMNALRLSEGVDSTLFSERTSVGLGAITEQLIALRDRGLMVEDPHRLRTTELGFRFLNDVIAEFA